MERDERAILVARGECRACVEEQRVRRPVARERRDGLLFRRTIAHLLAIATVLRRLHELAFDKRVEAVRPAEVVTLVHLKQLFRGILSAEFERGDRIHPELREPTLQIVATVLSRVELAVGGIDRDAYRVANSAREVIRRARCLILLPRVELPDAGARLELDTRIRAWR